MEDYYSEGGGFERVPGTFPFVDMKISNDHHATRVGLFSRVCVCLGSENGICFLCSNSSFHSLGVFFIFLFQIFEPWFFVNRLDFQVRIVAPKRFLEHSIFFSFFFFSLSFFLSLSLSLSLCFSLSHCVCFCLCVCVCDCVCGVFRLLSSLFPYFVLLKFNDQENQLSK